MNNREQLINEWLQYYAEYFKCNPQDITSDTIYSGLVNYNLSQFEYDNRNISYLFNEWIERYKNSNLNVFHSETQPGFLQFQNRNRPGNLKKEVKLYLNFAKHDMLVCAERVFDFIEKENIYSLSKISKNIRADSVVLRLGSEDDSKKVMDFINNDPYLSQRCRSTNPFLIKNGNVGMAFDGMLSFNRTLSDLLEAYYNNLYQEKRLNEASMENFRIFVHDAQQTIFNDPQNINEFVELFYNPNRFSSKGEMLRNYQSVYRLIELSLYNNVRMEDYFREYNYFVDRNLEMQWVNYFNSVIETKNHINQNQTNIQLNLEEFKLLNDYVAYAIKKYGYDTAIRNLKSYISDGKVNRITRDHDFRTKFMTMLPSNILANLVNYDLDKYLEQNGLTVQKTNDEYNVFYDACKQTYLKYGASQLKQALSYGTTGDYKYFTNGTNECRKKLQTVVSPQEFQGYIKYLSKSNIINESAILICCENISQEVQRQMQQNNYQS